MSLWRRHDTKQKGQISNVNSSFDDQLEATGFESSDIASVEPRYCEVRTVFDDIDLDFVRAIEVHLFDPFLAQSQREVFYLDPVPGNTKNVIRPFPGLQNIKELLDNPTVGVEVRVRFFQPPPTTFSFRVDLEFTAFTD